jgi:hypothetical protein
MISFKKTKLERNIGNKKEHFNQLNDNTLTKAFFTFIHIWHMLCFQGIYYRY